MFEHLSHIGNKRYIQSDRAMHRFQWVDSRCQRHSPCSEPTAVLTVSWDPIEPLRCPISSEMWDLRSKRRGQGQTNLLVAGTSIQFHAFRSRAGGIAQLLLSAIDLIDPCTRTARFIPCCASWTFKDFIDTMRTSIVSGTIIGITGKTRSIMHPCHAEERAMLTQRIHHDQHRVKRRAKNSLDKRSEQEQEVWLEQKSSVQ